MKPKTIPMDHLLSFIPPSRASKFTFAASLVLRNRKSESGGTALYHSLIPFLQFTLWIRAIAKAIHE